MRVKGRSEARAEVKGDRRAAAGAGADRAADLAAALLGLQHVAAGEREGVAGREVVADRCLMADSKPPPEPLFPLRCGTAVYRMRCLSFMFSVVSQGQVVDKNRECLH